MYNSIHEPKILACTSIVSNDTLSIQDRIHKQNMVDLINDESITRKELEILRDSNDDKLIMQDPNAELL